MNLSDKQIEAAAERCLLCHKLLRDRDRIVSAYRVSDVRRFDSQIELGIVGEAVRNFWTHLNCEKPRLEGYNLNPDIHHCIKCSAHLKKDDIVTPVFQVTDPNAVNPEDANDSGIALAERVYFIHAKCGDGNLRSTSLIIG